VCVSPPYPLKIKWAINAHKLDKKSGDIVSSSQVTHFGPTADRNLCPKLCISCTNDCDAINMKLWGGTQLELSAPKELLLSIKLGTI